MGPTASGPTATDPTMSPSITSNTDNAIIAAFAAGITTTEPLGTNNSTTAEPPGTDNNTESPKLCGIRSYCEEDHTRFSRHKRVDQVVHAR
jgi:hypothetical protein